MSNNRPTLRGNPLDAIGFLDGVTSDLGDWIANGNPAPDSIPGVVQKRYRDTCDSWSNGLAWVTNIAAPGRAVMSNICKPWLDAQGSGDPSLSDPPGFSGGQCPGARYDVSYTRTVIDTGQVFNNTARDVQGPVTGVGCFSGAQLQGAPSNVNYIGATSPNEPFSTNRFQFNDGTWLRWVQSSTAPLCDQFEVAITGVTRTDGQPDDCGDPPGGNPQPNPNPRPDPGLDPEDEPFEEEPGRPVIPMPPITEPFGDPVQLPNFPLPRIDSPSLFPGDEQPPSAEPGEPGVPETVEGDEEAEGEADEDEVLTGVLVEVDSAPGFARTVQNVSVPTYIGACYVYLGWEDQLDLQPEGQFLVDGQFFAAVPGMTHWRVRSAVGYTLTITPYYAPKE